MNTLHAAILLAAACHVAACSSPVDEKTQKQARAKALAIAAGRTPEQAGADLERAQIVDDRGEAKEDGGGGE
ncbi:MAG: hypothetical protein ACKN9T_19295 [Candidatus Methylumidiphilus sp.]